ncbi:MAG: hypothetical protein WDN69_13095 [Aliidongia sp.]
MPRSISGTPPAPAEHAEHRIARHDAQIAPQASSSPPATAGPSIAAITGLPSCSRVGPHRSVALGRERAGAAPGEFLEIGAGAESAAGAGQDRDRTACRLGPKARKASASARAVAPSTALRSAGRSIATMATSSGARSRRS